jgi:putative serine protease PepD
MSESDPNREAEAAEGPAEPTDPTSPAATPEPTPDAVTSEPEANPEPAREPVALATAASTSPPPLHTAAAPASAAPTPAPKRNVGPLVAALAVGALVGGASGAGVAAWALSANVSQDEASGGPQTITVNDPEDVNIVNAVAAKASPSVVTINVTAGSGGGSGSGVVLSDDGYVLTNNHVITLGGATADGTIEVTTTDGRLYTAEVVGTDPVVDLAVIKLRDASGLQPIEFADVSELDVGDRVIAIGAPLGLSNTVTDGIVSALNRSIDIASSAVPEDEGDQAAPDDQGDDDFFNFEIPGQQTQSPSARISIPVIQTDAAINPGNSGGALVDDQGRLVGINVAIASAGSAGGGSGSIGVGFAIPVDLAQRVADELIANGTASHGLLGATVRDATSKDGSVVGSVIDSIVDGGAAAAAGLEAGDIVTEFNGIPITNRVDLTAQVRALAGGSDVEISYLRGSDEHTTQVTLGEFEQ